jgi:hypothetical protein
VRLICLDFVAWVLLVENMSIVYIPILFVKKFVHAYNLPFWVFFNCLNLFLVIIMILCTMDSMKLNILFLIWDYKKKKRFQE